MGKKDWVSGDLTEKAEGGTLGHLLMWDFQLEKTGRRASFGRGLLLQREPRGWGGGGTRLSKSQQDYPVVKGCRGEPPPLPS